MEMKKYESDLTYREKKQIEIRKIKALPWKKRMEYLWTYYRFVLLVIFFIAVVVGMVYTGVINSKIRPVMSIAITDAEQGKEEQIKGLEEEILNAVGSENSQDKVAIDASGTSSDQPAQNIKTILLASSLGENDLIICDEKTFRKFEGQGAFASWKDVLGKDYERYAQYMKEDAVDLSICPKWAEKGITDYEPVYCCVLKDAPHKKKLKPTLECLTKK